MSLRTVVVLALLALSAWPTAAPGQDASPFVAPEHWAHAAIERLIGLGLAPGGEWGSQARTRAELHAGFTTALMTAESDEPEFVDVISAYLERLEEEFPSLGNSSDSWDIEARVAARYAQHQGAVRTGSNIDFSTPLGPEPVDSEPGAALASVSTGNSVITGLAELGHFDGKWGARRLQVVTGWQGVAVWGGRRYLGWRNGQGGGMIFNGAVPVDGGGLDLVDPLRLPGPLGLLGPIRFETFLARIDRNGAFERPWLWGARGSLSPHPRFGLAASRGAMFGGEGNEPVTPRDIAYVILGKHGSGGSRFENQLASVTVWAVPPIPLLPLRFYLEWGLEDSAGAWQDVPGVLAGVELLAVPRMPEVSVAIDYASYAEQCCGNPPWYRHWAFLDGWTDGGRPLGHPLGGNGTEWRASARADVLEARLHVEAAGFWRERRADNLYAPDRQGESTGASLRVTGRPASWLECTANAFVEVGEAGWSESRVAFRVEAVYH